MTGRIVDLRDPDTYIPYSVYAECVENARKRNEERRCELEKWANKKLHPIGLSMKLKIWFGSTGRTYMDIIKVEKGNESKVYLCRLSDGENMEKETKRCVKELFDEYLKR